LFRLMISVIVAFLTTMAKAGVSCARAQDNKSLAANERPDPNKA
jgi:hypothetical protein